MSHTSLPPPRPARKDALDRDVRMDWGFVLGHFSVASEIILKTDFFSSTRTPCLHHIKSCSYHPAVAICISRGPILYHNLSERQRNSIMRHMLLCFLLLAGNMIRCKYPFLNFVTDLDSDHI